MFFSTIEEYNKELSDIKSTLDSMESRFDEEPKSEIRKANHKGLKEIYDIILKDKEDFIEMMNENINLHLLGDSVKNHDISIPVITTLFNNFNSLTSCITLSLKNNLNYSFESHDLKLKEVNEGSIQILVSMDKDITNLKEVYLNNQVFNKLLDLVDCSGEELSKEVEIIGKDSILAYKNFLKVFIDNELDFTLENNSRKVGLTHDDALEIYKKIEEDGI